MPRIRTLAVGVLTALLAAGCRIQAKGVPIQEVLRDPVQILRNEKILIASAQRGDPARAQVELSAANYLRGRGLNASARAEALPQWDSLKGAELRNELQKASFTISCQIDYKPEDVGPDGVPKKFSMSMATIKPERKAPPGAAVGATLAQAALQALILGLFK